MSQPCQPRLPLEPLMVLAGADRAVTTWSQSGDSPSFYRGQEGASYSQSSPLTTLAELIGASRRTVCRWMSAGIPLRAAEDACDALSLHPCEVWGDEWIDACLQ